MQAIVPNVINVDQDSDIEVVNTPGVWSFQLKHVSHLFGYYLPPTHVKCKASPSFQSFTFYSFPCHYYMAFPQILSCFDSNFSYHVCTKATTLEALNAAGVRVSTSMVPVVTMNCTLIVTGLIWAVCPQIAHAIQDGLKLSQTWAEDQADNAQVFNKANGQLNLDAFLSTHLQFQLMQHCTFHLNVMAFPSIWLLLWFSFTLPIQASW